MAVLFGTGCPGPAPNPVPKTTQPYAGVTLKLTGSDATVLAALTVRSQGWCSRHAVTLKTVDNLRDADVIIGTPAQVGEFAAKDDAQRVPEELRTLEHPCQWNGIIGPYRNGLAAWAGEPRAIPLAGDGAVLVLNTQRLADPALKDKYLTKFGRPLPSTPVTWEDLAEISETCADLKLASVPSSLEDFFRVAACHDRMALVGNTPKNEIAMISFTHVADTGAPRLATPGLEAGAKWRARTRHGAATMASGQAAWDIMNLAELGRLPKVDGVVAAHFAVAPLPGSRTTNSQVNTVPYFNGGWFGIVRKNCSNPAAAFDLLADLSSPARSLEMLSDATLGFGPFRNEHFEQSRESVWQSYGFDAERTRALADALRRNSGIAAVNPAFGLRGPDAAALTAMLAKAIDGPDPMATAQKLWLDHDAKQPEAKTWRRRAAGLP